MKKIYLSLFLFIACISLSMAQVVPSGFNYQAGIRDAAGNVRKGATVNLRFSLLPEQFSGSPAWVETHTTLTDSLGICTLVIGNGTKTGGTATTFADVDFAASNYWLKVELQEGGQYVELGGAQQLMSVPYACSCQSSGRRPCHSRRNDHAFRRRR